jgi:methanogenic corrinoid protein MtbC1
LRLTQHLPAEGISVHTSIERHDGDSSEPFHLSAGGMAMPQANDFDGGLDRPIGSLRSGTESARNATHHAINHATNHGDARSTDSSDRSLPCCGRDSGPCDACEERKKPQRDLERFVTLLMKGDRAGCRDFVREQLNDGRSAIEVLEHLVWPACSIIDGWSRRDRIGAVHQACATMLLSQLVQRLEAGIPRKPARCRKVLVASGPKPLEELAAEIFAGLAEADGFEVVFLGGGVESDDLFEEIGARSPTFMVSYAASGSDAAALRRLLTALREQKPVPGLRVGAGGGVFSRAPGLAEELGVDFSGDSPFDLLEALRREACAVPARAKGARAA